MIVNALNELFVRDLNKLKQELLLYKDEASLWKIDHDIKNSGGNLCLHIIGNLKTFIGDGLGKSGYIRDRAFEFAGKNVERALLTQQIDETIEAVNIGLSTLNDAQLTEDFPIQIWETKTQMGFTLIHLHSHLTYHLGQLNYHRRILG